MEDRHDRADTRRRGLGWGPLAGASAVITVAVALGVAATPTLAALGVILVAVPTAWLAYLVGLSRPSEPGPGTEWYPLGRALLHFLLKTL